MRSSVINLLDQAHIGDLIRPIVRGVREQRQVLRTMRWRISCRRKITAYFDQHAVRKLQLGASDKTLEDWLNSDLEGTAGNIYLDASKPFPFKDSSLDFVFCEHFIEHLSYADGAFCMREVFRCLKPGGVFRVATPNLSQYVRLFHDTAPAGREFMAAFQSQFKMSRINPCLALNHIFFNWAHAFLYDETELMFVLREAGFSKVEQLKVGESAHPALQGLERHGQFYGDAMNEYETMVFEATKL